MALISLRTLTNDANATTYDFSSSPTDTWFAEDYNRIRQSIQTGETGVRTFSLQVGDSTVPSSSGQARFGKDLVVGSGLTATDVALVLTGTSAFTGNMDVTGNITVSGTVDTVDLLAHDHSGGASGAAIPLPSITGASGAWSAHSHSGDGSAQITVGGYADGSIIFSKLNASAVGLGASQVAEGDDVAEVRDALSGLLNPSTTDFPMLGQFIPASEMFSVSGDTEADLVLHSGSPGCDIFARHFNVAGETVRVTTVTPKAVNSVRMYGIYVVENATVGSPASESSPGEVDLTLDRMSIDTFMVDGSKSTSVWSPAPVENGFLTVETMLSWIPLNSPDDAETATVTITVNTTDSDIYLMGVALVYDVNYGAW